MVSNMLLLLLLLVSMASGELIPMDNTTIPENMASYLSFVDGHLAANCGVNSTEPCDVSFMAQFSNQRKLNFFFDKRCRMVGFVFNGERRTVTDKIVPASNLTLYSYGKIEVNGDENPEYPKVSRFCGTVINVTVTLFPSCPVQLTEGVAVVEGIPPTNVTAVVEDVCLSCLRGKNQLHIIYGTILGSLALLLCLVIAIHCLCKKKKPKVIPQESERLTVGPIIPPDYVRVKTIVKSVKESASVLKKFDVVAATGLINNDKLKTMFTTRKTEPTDGETCLPSAVIDGVQKMTSDVLYIAILSWFHTMRYDSQYFKTVNQKEAADDAKKIADNRKKFFELGPPRILDMNVYDMIVCDTMPHYLLNTCVITKEEFHEMEELLPRDVRCSLLESEVLFLKERELCAWASWKSFLKESREAFKKHYHLKGDKAALIDALRSDPDCGSFQLLLWFYEFYGAQYIDKIPLNFYIMSRLPLQGLMLLLLRPDMDIAKEKSIVGWFKVTSFGLMRRTDLGAYSQFVAYPLHVMAKMWFSHNFYDVLVEDVKDAVKLLDVADPTPDKDWTYL